MIDMTIQGGCFTVYWLIADGRPYDEKKLLLITGLSRDFHHVFRKCTFLHRKKQFLSVKYWLIIKMNLILIYPID